MISVGVTSVSVSGSESSFFVRIVIAVGSGYSTRCNEVKSANKFYNKI